MLEVRDITAGYGQFTALWDVSLRVDHGEAVAVVGPNGAGKTTLLRVISGLIAPRAGALTFDGTELAGRPAHQIVRHGIAHVPEGRRLFPALTVADNLKMGAFLPAARARFTESLERVYALFPVLAERRAQRAGSMSGGEQQMLAVARALMSSPRILLVDEPSVGLAPILVSRVIAKIRELKEQRHLTVLMAEQNFNQATKIADRGYIIVHGKIEFEGKSTRELRENELVKKYYLGV